jgi:hypothetical protein
VESKGPEDLAFSQSSPLDPQERRVALGGQPLNRILLTSRVRVRRLVDHHVYIEADLLHGHGRQPVRLGHDPWVIAPQLQGVLEVAHQQRGAFLHPPEAELHRYEPHRQESVSEGVLDRKRKGHPCLHVTYVESVLDLSDAGLKQHPRDAPPTHLGTDRQAPELPHQIGIGAALQTHRGRPHDLAGLDLLGHENHRVITMDELLEGKPS